ncbi:hypothetical protein ACP6PK_20205 [Dapis sp. BLCC M172]
MTRNGLAPKVSGGNNNSNSIHPRSHLKEKIVGLLKKGQSLYITGEASSGKSNLCEAIAQSLKSERLPVATLAPGTAKEILIGVCEDLGIDPNEG